ATDSTPVASRPVGTRWALIPGSSVSVLLRALAWTPSRFPEPAGPRRALQKLAEIEVVSLKALPENGLVEVWGLEVTVWRVQEPASQARLTGCAVMTVTRIVRVDLMGTEAIEFPHRNTPAVVVPVETAPARVRGALKVRLVRPPDSCPVPGPDGHSGLARHASVQPLGPLPRSESAPVVIRTSTVHRPCQRAAETGGDVVFTVRTGDSADRLPSRTAATRYW